MPQVSDQAKQIIDSMSMEEMIEESKKGTKSRFQGANFDYLVARIDIVKNQEENDKYQQTLSISKEANNLAKSSNEISKQSNQIAGEAKGVSKMALWVAIGALIVSILTPIIQHYIK
ncbi:hypothetical protein GCM10010975_09830 [Comamonas phosphati]|nr:hypothetical protein GCM10010975_09830 [Comamonas phosphati]